MFRGCKYSDVQACHMHVRLIKGWIGIMHVTFAHEHLDNVKPSRPEGPWRLV